MITIATRRAMDVARNLTTVDPLKNDTAMEAVAGEVKDTTARVSMAADLVTAEDAITNRAARVMVAVRSVNTATSAIVDMAVAPAAARVAAMDAAVATVKVVTVAVRAAEAMAAARAVVMDEAVTAVVRAAMAEAKEAATDEVVTTAKAAAVTAVVAEQVAMAAVAGPAVGKEPPVVIAALVMAEAPAAFLGPAVTAAAQAASDAVRSLTVTTVRRREVLRNGTTIRVVIDPVASRTARADAEQNVPAMAAVKVATVVDKIGPEAAKAATVAGKSGPGAAKAATAADKSGPGAAKVATVVDRIGPVASKAVMDADRNGPVVNKVATTRDKDKNAAGGTELPTRSLHGLATKKRSDGVAWMHATNTAGVGRKVIAGQTSAFAKTSTIA